MGRSARYPYHLWRDGEWHDVHPAEWDKTVESMRASLHQWGKNNRLKLVSRRVDDDTLSIRFVRPE